VKTELKIKAKIEAMLLVAMTVALSENKNETETEIEEDSYLYMTPQGGDATKEGFPSEKSNQQGEKERKEAGGLHDRLRRDPARDPYLHLGMALVKMVLVTGRAATGKRTMAKTGTWIKVETMVVAIGRGESVWPLIPMKKRKGQQREIISQQK